MKATHTICVTILTTIFVANVTAEEIVEQASYSMQGADMYMNEILATCRAEAEGMDDAETYINECVNNMKQGFNESN